MLICDVMLCTVKVGRRASCLVCVCVLVCWCVSILAYFGVFWCILVSRGRSIGSAFLVSLHGLFDVDRPTTVPWLSSCGPMSVFAVPFYFIFYFILLRAREPD